MFQALIDQAHDMIERLYACAEKGRSDVPLAVTIRYSEYEAWETAVYGILRTVFGPEAAETSRWRALADRRATLLGEARHSDMKRGEFLGLIDYFNLAIGVLREYDAAYQHKRSSANQAADQAADTSTVLAPVYAHEQPQQPASQEHFDENDQFEEPEVARRVAEDRWDVIISLSNGTYDWLFEMAAAREPTQTADSAAVARLAAAIIERVAAQKTQRSREHGVPERPQAR